MFIELVKKSAKTIVINPSIPLYFVLALIIFKLIAPYAAASNIPLISAILLICLFLLSSCFLAGWFQIFKESATLKSDEIKEKKFFPVFLEGVGKNVFPISVSVLLYLTFSLITILIACFIASKIFGDLTLIMKHVLNSATDSVSAIEFINNLDKSEKEILYGWQICILAGMAILDFILMFYPSALVSDNKTNIILRPFKALVKSIVFLFKNFFKCLLIYFAIYIIYLALEALGALLSFSGVLTILVLFVHIYFISIALMIVFNYYESKIKKEDNCSDRCDCIRENEPCDTISEEDK